MFVETAAMDYKKTLSQLTELKDTLTVASEFSVERNQIIFGFLIKETIRIYHTSKNRFYRSQDDIHVQARAGCFYLTKKHTSIPIRVMARQFDLNHSNVCRRIELVKSALEIRVTYEEFIGRISLIENNLLQFLHDNKISHGIQK